MRISIIAAIAENGVIGREGRLPWHLAGDLRRFRELTSGHTLIMGRRTWESIGRPLPQRRMVVLTRQANYPSEGVETVANLDEALARATAAGDDEAFVIGGAELFRLALPRAERLYLTRVHATIEGDVCFPPFDRSQWQLVQSEYHDADDRNDYPFTIETYERP